MKLTLAIDYDQLMALVTQLSEEEQNRLIVQMLLKRAEARPLSVEEKLQLWESAKIRREVNEMPSIRREDWYDDDGR